MYYRNGWFDVKLYLVEYVVLIILMLRVYL